MIATVSDKVLKQVEELISIIDEECGADSKNKIYKFEIPNYLHEVFPYNLALAIFGSNITVEDVNLRGVREAMQHVSCRNREVLNLRFRYPCLTYEQIGARFNISKDRARTLVQKALQELRAPEFTKLIKINNEVVDFENERAQYVGEIRKLKRELNHMEFELKKLGGEANGNQRLQRSI